MFLQILIFKVACIWSLATIYNLFPLSSIYFQENACQISVWINRSSSVSGSMKNSSQFSYNSVAFLERTIIIHMRSALCIPPNPSFSILKKYTQGRRLSISNKFHCFIKDILNWIFKILNALWERIQRLLVQFGATALICPKTPAIYSSRLLHRWYKCQHGEKDKKIILVLLWN